MVRQRKWGERLCFAHERDRRGALTYQCQQPVAYHCVLQGEDVYLCEAHREEFRERNQAEGIAVNDLFERIPAIN